jgi:hypothetical protein
LVQQDLALLALALALPPQPTSSAATPTASTPGNEAAVSLLTLVDVLDAITAAKKWRIESTPS